MIVNRINQWLQLTSVSDDLLETVIFPKDDLLSSQTTGFLQRSVNLTVTLVFVVYLLGFLLLLLFLGSGAGPGFPNKKASIFSLGEITRLMKFPGVVRTFIVKIAAGLPSGETITKYVHEVR